MLVINADNVNEAYYGGLLKMKMMGKFKDSRNGRVLSFPQPVTTSYNFPHERILFDEKRDANPFLHLFEAIWMLGGRNDVAFPAMFAPQMREYSDDGDTLHGAYGHRWRNHFKTDQLQKIIFELYTNKNSRRAVLSMWDPYIDPAVAEVGGKDVPCNTHIYFNVRADGVLDMTVCNRSNDMIWGAYGANVVHMSMLHEYVALAVGVHMGTYYQMSNDLHVYEKHFHLMEAPRLVDPYTSGEAVAIPLWSTHSGIAIETQKQFDRDVGEFLRDPFTAVRSSYYTKFFADTVHPMALTWKLHKGKYAESALQMTDQIEASDWRLAARQWLARRAPKAAANDSQPSADPT